MNHPHQYPHLRRRSLLPRHRRGDVLDDYLPSRIQNARLRGRRYRRIYGRDNRSCAPRRNPTNDHRKNAARSNNLHRQKRSRQKRRSIRGGYYLHGHHTIGTKQAQSGVGENRTDGVCGDE